MSPGSSYLEGQSILRVWSFLKVAREIFSISAPLESQGVLEGWSLVEAWSQKEAHSIWREAGEVRQLPLLRREWASAPPGQEPRNLRSDRAAAQRDLYLHLFHSSVRFQQHLRM